MEQVFEVISSQPFRDIMHNISIVCLVFAVGAVVILLTFYGRGREAAGLKFNEAKWVLLFATWRDSLIITVLFVAQGFVYRFKDFYTMSEELPGSVISYPPFLSLIFDLILDILMLTVATVRIAAISKWLAGIRAQAPLDD